jgi:hypothetical protein
MARLRWLHDTERAQLRLQSDRAATEAGARAVAAAEAAAAEMARAAARAHAEAMANAERRHARTLLCCLKVPAQ